MITGRSFLARGSAAATLITAGRAFEQWQPSMRYPDPLIQVGDESFAAYRPAATKVERLLNTQGAIGG
jgi:hypothetical protein